MFARRVDDRIRHLCHRIAVAGNDELEAILQELLAAIHEKMERLRILAVKQLVRGESYKERRTSQP